MRTDLDGIPEGGLQVRNELKQAVVSPAQHLLQHLLGNQVTVCPGESTACKAKRTACGS
jgi:hypothetical protein